MLTWPLLVDTYPDRNERGLVPTKSGVCFPEDVRLQHAKIQAPALPFDTSSHVHRPKGGEEPGVNWELVGSSWLPGLKEGTGGGCFTLV